MTSLISMASPLERSNGGFRDCNVGVPPRARGDTKRGAAVVGARGQGIASNGKADPRQALRCTLGLRNGSFAAFAFHASAHHGYQRAGLFLRSTQSLAARQQREHQRLAATVFPEGNRSVARPRKTLGFETPADRLRAVLH